MNPRALVGDLMSLLQEALPTFVEEHLRREHGAMWTAALTGTYNAKVRVDSRGRVEWDVQSLVKALISAWDDVFRSPLGGKARTYVFELKDARNAWAHQEAISLEDAERWWDTARMLFRAARLDPHAERAGEVLARMRTGAGASVPQPVNPVSAAAEPSPGGTSRTKPSAKDSAKGSPWSVLTDPDVVAAARKAFGATSLNPFYSNPARTIRQGAIYVVALNPGGDPAAIPTQREDMPLDHEQRPAGRPDWCKLLDEDWGTNYQASAVHLARHALPGGERGLREAFCTNALFMRGPIKSGIDVKGLWSACRPWHVEWLRVVQPTRILCLGNGEGHSPYAWFRGLIEEPQSLAPVATYNNFTLKACAGSLFGRAVTLIGTPHPAHWSASSPKSTRAVEAVRRLLADAP